MYSFCFVIATPLKNNWSTFSFLLLWFNFYLPTYFPYWPLTEPSCFNCVNRKTAICGCKQITWVDSRKRVTRVDNWKRLGVVKSYMQTTTVVMVSQSYCRQSEEIRAFKRLGWRPEGRGKRPFSSEKQKKCQVRPWILHNADKKLWINIAILSLSSSSSLSLCLVSPSPCLNIDHKKE